MSSLDVAGVLPAADVLEQHLDEEAGLLGVGDPHDGAAVARGRVVARVAEAVTNMQHLLCSCTHACAHAG